MIASYNGKKSDIAWQFLVRDGNWGGGGYSVLELYSLGSSHGPDKDGSFFVLLHRNEWRWLILDIGLQFIKPDVDVIKVLEIMIE